MDVNLVMNGILMVLLVTVLWYGVGLNKRLKALRAAHEGFAKAVGELDDAAIRAHTALKELRANADDSQELLHGRILAARDVLQKLDLQVTRAERVQKDIDKGLASFETLRTQPLPRTDSRPEPRSELRPEPRVETMRPEVIRPAHYEPVRETAPGRHPFLNDMVRPRESRPKDVPLNQTPYARKGRSLLPDIPPQDDSEMVDAVQMSELVVANLNEMIRTLNLPTRQVMSVEDDLFGGTAPKNR
ncbi:DUF6468 domain-containing protein [Asticcacaulis sp. 201]|uniref:DUF6468 domain-containing protein n=1 Tax=Asticcacaulis sp. 201 TaxID=3028787 RepID=UPI0029163545|nr:DUF6468 domain-containing protein [Asticcacaulis sp. 201]MDV6330549.1 DUF6468 domain-containing protein [Asticcacaulis sp. 201]